MHPVKGYSISTGFKKAGRLWSLGWHTGVDYACASRTNVYAVADGTIVSARYDGSFGNFLAVDHKVGSKTYRAYYCHLSSFVRKSGKVKRGEHIGESGATGNVTGPHLHFEVRESPFGFTPGDIVNPSVLYNLGGGSVDKMDPAAYYLGASGSHVTWLGKRLIEHGYGRFYTVGAGPNFTAADRSAVKAFQKAQGWTGADADGYPGKQTLSLLAAAPKVDGKKHVATYVVDTDVLNSRRGPSTKSEILSQVPRGREFKSDLISTDGKWVRSGDSKRWYALEFLKKKAAAPKPTPAPKPDPTPKPTPDEPVDGTPEGGGPRPIETAVPGLGLNILPRSAWTDRGDERDEDLDPERVVAMTLHWPGDGVSSYATLDPSGVADLLRRWLAAHLAKTWKDIGYNYAVDMAGMVWDLTGDDIGAHASTAGNPTSLGVILVVGKDDVPSAAMKASVRALFAAKQPKFPKMAGVQGHQEVPGNATECPGPHVLAAMRAGAFGRYVGGEGTPVEPEESDPASITLLTQNVIVRRLSASDSGYDSWKEGLDYVKRVPYFGDIKDAVGADVVVTQESGTYANGDLLSAEFGHDWDNRLHGDNGDLTNAVHAGNGWREIVGGKFETHGDHHNWATWSLIGNGSKKALIGTSHFEYRKRGESAANVHDRTRQQQAKVFATQLKALAEQYQPDVTALGLDANSDLHDAADVAPVMRSLGFRDAEEIAAEHVGTEFGTLNNLTPGLKKGRRLDRWFILTGPDQPGVARITTVAGHPASDHNGVAIDVPL